MNTTKGDNLMNSGAALSILSFLVGSILGVLVTGGILGKEYRKKFDSQKDEIDYLRGKAHRSAKKNEHLLDELGKRLENSEGADSSEPSPVVRRFKGRTYIDDDVGPEDDRPLEDPYRITEYEFQSDIRFSESSSLTYYKRNGVLADERDEIVADPEDTVGPQIYGELPTMEEDNIYIHNSVHDMNYEIAIEHGLDYYVDILGEEQPDNDEDGSDKED